MKKKAVGEPGFISNLLSTFSVRHASRSSGLSSADLKTIQGELYLEAAARNQFTALIFMILGLFYFILDLSLCIYSGGIDRTNVLGMTGCILYFFSSAIYFLVYHFYLKKHPKSIRAAIDFFYAAVFSAALIFMYKDFLSFEGARLSDFSFATIVLALYCFVPLISSLDWGVMAILELTMPLLVKYLAGASVSFLHYYQTFIIIAVFLLGSLSLRTLNFTQRVTLYKNKLANDRLKSLMAKDGLTGMGNRYAMAIDEKILQKTEPQGDVYFFMMDIDNFKLYNDEFSHPAGDECLKLVSQALDNILSGHSLKLYRFGGEEFLAFGALSLKTALSLSVELKDSVSRLKIPAPKGYLLPYISISIGVSRLDASSFTLKKGIEEADRSLYLSKNRGRNLCSYKDVSYSSQKEIPSFIS